MQARVGNVFSEPFQVTDTPVTGLAHITKALGDCHRLSFYSEQPSPDGQSMEHIIAIKIILTDEMLHQLITQILTHRGDVPSNICRMCKDMDGKH